MKIDPRERSVFVDIKDHADEGVYDLLTNFQDTDDGEGFWLPERLDSQSKAEFKKRQGKGIQRSNLVDGQFSLID